MASNEATAHNVSIMTGEMFDTDTEEADRPIDQPPLARSQERKILAGVAAGLGERTNLSPWWFRIGFVALSLVGGLGVLLYVLAWLLIPNQGEIESVAEQQLRHLHDGKAWLGAALILVAAILTFGSIGLFPTELMWAAALIVAGVLLYRGLPDPAHTSREPEAPDRLEADDSMRATGPHRPPRPPRERSALGPYTVGAGLIVIAIVAVLDNAGAIDPRVSHYLAAAVGVVGLGLLAGAWYGRSRGLIVLGALLTPLLLVASLIRVPLGGDFGEEVFRPSSVAGVLDSYRMAAGSLEIDLTRIQLDEQTVNVEATVGAGEITVFVPSNAGLVLEGKAGIGEVYLLGFHTDGIDVRKEVVRSGTGTIALTLEAGLGSVQVISAE